MSELNRNDSLLSQFDDILNDVANELLSLSTLADTGDAFTDQRSPTQSECRGESPASLGRGGAPGGSNKTEIIVPVNMELTLLSQTDTSSSFQFQASQDVHARTCTQPDSEDVSSKCPLPQISIEPPPEVNLLRGKGNESADNEKTATQVEQEEGEVHKLAQVVKTNPYTDEESLDFTDTELALEQILDELQELSAESTCEVSETDSGSTESIKFITMKSSRERLEPPFMSQEQRVRLSISILKDETVADLDALIEELNLVEKEMSSGSSKEVSEVDLAVLPGDLQTDSNHSATSLDDNVDDNEKTPTEQVLLLHEDKRSSVTSTSSTGANDLLEKLGFTNHLSADTPEADRSSENSGHTGAFTEPGDNTDLSPEILHAERIIADILKKEKINPDEEEGRERAARLRTALVKIKESNILKVYVKVYNHEQRTTKTLLIDQTWICRDLTHKMIVKDDVKPGPEWCIVEKLPGMFMERVLEDGEFIAPTVVDWSRNTDNFLVFMKRKGLYSLFREPHSFLMNDRAYPDADKLTDESKKALLQDFFTKDAMQVPSTEGVLWLKEGRKKWVKHYFVLRASGIYYTPKGKTKSRDITCIASFAQNNVYTCLGYDKLFKAPTPHVFCLKPSKVQTLKSNHINILCAADARTKDIWVTVIRMAKYGYTMYEDYLIAQERDLILSSGRSLRHTITRSSSFKTYSLYSGFSSRSHSPSSSACSTSSLPRKPPNGTQGDEYRHSSNAENIGGSSSLDIPSDTNGRSSPSVKKLSTELSNGKSSPLFVSSESNIIITNANLISGRNSPMLNSHPLIIDRTTSAPAPSRPVEDEEIRPPTPPPCPDAAPYGVRRRKRRKRLRNKEMSGTI